MLAGAALFSGVPQLSSEKLIIRAKILIKDVTQMTPPTSANSTIAWIKGDPPGKDGSMMVAHLLGISVVGNVGIPHTCLSPH